jgi:TolB-like protein/lipoprotein NlpI
MVDQRPFAAKYSPQSRDPDPDEITAQVNKILSSTEFAQSDRLQKFLNFIVDETLAGRSNLLKEYSIALEVFGRDESFDPQTSSIVRVEASRLRGKLDKYNATDGRDDPITISLPPGSYVPTFDVAGAEIDSAADDDLRTGPAQSSRPSRMVFVLAVLVLVIGGSVLFVFRNDFLKSSEDGTPEAPKTGHVVSVAVLPLRNLSGNPDLDYFSDGITDALIANLAKGGMLRVISLTSAMAYKNVNRLVPDIARELNVSHVVEGSVLRINDKVRITAQLIEANSDHHLWSETYARDVADVLAIQDEVVQKIVASLLDQVPSTVVTSPKTSTSIDPAAYEAQLKGRYFLNKMTVEGLKKGIAYFQEAIEKAPDYAAAHSGMATCYCLLGGHGFEVVKPDEGMPAARRAVLEALRLDDSQAEPHAFLGIIRLKYEWNWSGAEASFMRSIQLNPSYARARLFNSFYLEAMGRQDEAIHEAEEARAIDPLSLATNINLGWQYLQAEQLEQARQVFKSTAELDPDFWGVHWGMGHYHQRMGEYDEAIAEFEKAISAGGGHTLPLTALGYTFAVSGKIMEARKIIDQLTDMAKESYVSPYSMATIYAGLGADDDAFVWLEKAFAARSRSMAWLNVADEMDGLRLDPRFKSLLERIGLPE